MCELLAVSSRQPTKLTFSLGILAAHSRPAGSSRDGWGAAFYQGLDVALFREPQAASDSPMVRLLESSGPSTSLAISHIRHATQGNVSLANTQPFVRELMGRTHCFAHNGHLPGITHHDPLSLGRFQPVGRTDSEHAFCALLQRLTCLWGDTSAKPSAAKRLEVVKNFAADLRVLGPANFLYSDGEILFAHGHKRIQAGSGLIKPPGLFTLSRQCVEAQERVDTSGLTVGCGYQEVLLVASVPLSDELWRPLDEGEVIAISLGKAVVSVN